MSAKLTEHGWYATDRYTIARWLITSHDSTNENVEITVPLEALEWITKINVRQLRHQFIGDTQLDYRLRIEETPNEQGTPDTLTVTIMHGDTAERSQAFNAQPGNYPPVERLIDSWKPAVHEPYSVRINPVHLEKVTSFVKRHEKEAPIEIELGEHTEGKPSPTRITYDRLTVLIQPNLKL